MYYRKNSFQNLSKKTGEVVAFSPKGRILLLISMVNVAQSVERQVVVLVVEGSIPSVHPSFRLFH